MRYDVVYDLIEAVKISPYDNEEKQKVLDFIKRTMDDTIALSIQMAKTADAYVRLESELEENFSNSTNEKFNKVLDEIETDQMQEKIENLANDFEQIIGVGDRFGIKTGLEDLDTSDSIDIMLEAKQLVDEMAINGLLRYTMFRDKENPLSKEEAMQIVEAKAEERDINLTRINNSYLEMKQEEKDFEHKIEKTQEEQVKMDEKIEREIQHLDL